MHLKKEELSLGREKDVTLIKDVGTLKKGIILIYIKGIII